MNTVKIHTNVVQWVLLLLLLLLLLLPPSLYGNFQGFSRYLKMLLLNSRTVKEFQNQQKTPHSPTLKLITTLQWDTTARITTTLAVPKEVLLSKANNRKMTDI